MNKNIEVMSYLIGRGAKIDVTNKKSQTVNTLKYRGEMTQLIDNYAKMLANNEQKRAILLAASRKVHTFYIYFTCFLHIFYINFT